MIFKIIVVLLAIGIVFGIINFINIDQHYLGTVAYIESVNKVRMQACQGLGIVF